MQEDYDVAKRGLISVSMLGEFSSHCFDAPLIMPVTVRLPSDGQAGWPASCSISQATPVATTQVG
jgi:hypothetical protein